MWHFGQRVAYSIPSIILFINVCLSCSFFSALKTTPAPRRQGKQIQEAVQEERQEKEIVETQQQEPKQRQVGEEESDGSEKDQDEESAKDPAEDIPTDDDKDSAADEESAKDENEESEKDGDDEESPKDQDEVYNGHSEIPISAQDNDRGDDPDDSMRVDVIDAELLNYVTVDESTLVEPLVMETTTEQDGTIVYRFSQEELAGNYKMIILTAFFYIYGYIFFL